MVRDLTAAKAWLAGLQLVAWAVQGCSPARCCAKAIGGKRHAIIEFRETTPTHDGSRPALRKCGSFSRQGHAEN